MNKKKHICGCITEKKEDAIYFLKRCDHHKISGYVYVALKHDGDKK